MNTHSLSLVAASSQYAYRNDSSSFNFTTALTIEIAVKFNSLPSVGSFMALVSKWEPGNSQPFMFRLGNQWNGSSTYDLILDTGNGVNANNLIVPLGFTPTTGVWYYFAVTWDGATTTARFYNKGVELGNTTGSHTSLASSLANMKIGAGDGGHYVDGLIDEVRLWNIVRTATQLLENYASEISAQSGLEGYYKFNNDYTDSSGNALDLTSSGSPTFSTTVSFVDPKILSEVVTVVDSITTNVTHPQTKELDESVVITDTLTKSISKTLIETITINSIFSGSVPISAGSVVVYKSSQTDSDGGTITSTPVVSNTVDNLFPEVTQNQSEFGLTTYRKIFVKNEHPTSTWTDVRAFLGSIDDYTADTYAIGVGTSSDTDGSAISYSSPTSRVDGISLGDLAPGDSAAIWVKRVVSAGAELYKPLNDFIIYFGGV